MTLVRGVTTALSVALLSGAAAAAEPTEAAGGTAWRYELRALGGKAGEAVVEIGPEETIGGAPLRAIRIDARTEGVAKNFLDATSMAVTWVNQSWLPVRARWDQVFDNVKRVVKASYTHKGVEGTDERDGKLFESPKWDLGQHPLDLVSIFGWIIRQELSPGNAWEIPCFDGRRIYTVKVKVGIAKEIQLPVGFRKAIPLRGTVTRGSYKRDVEMWISADRDRVPLKMVFKYGLLGKVEAVFVGERKS